MATVFRTFLMALSLVVAFPSTLLFAEDADLKFSFTEDPRPWNLVYQGGVDQQKVYEYIPANTTLDKWTDIVTVQYLVGQKITPKNYYDRFLDALKTNAPFNKVESKIIKQDDKSLFWEWSINDNSPLDQHEWIRVFVDGDYTAFLRYTTKDMKSVSKYGQIWNKIISDATFIPPKETVKPIPSAVPAPVAPASSAVPASAAKSNPAVPAPVAPANPATKP